MNLNDDNDVIKLCNYFDKCKLETEKNKVVVERFLDNLKKIYNKKNDFFIKHSSFVGIGSSYEDTVSGPRADFDIAMILPIPFRMDSFTCIMKEPGLYMLQNTPKSFLLSNYVAQGDFLHIESLRKKIFAELGSVLKNVTFEKYKVSFKFTRFSSSFCVKLEYANFFIKIDIVPQIKAVVNDIPEWKGENLPKVIQDYIMRKNYHILFNLSCPPNFKKNHIKHLIVQPSFNLLEKVGMLNSDTVRYSVCITKAVYKYYRWSSKGLRSFHIKRVALILYNQIDLCKDPWVGYVLIMEEMITMLEDGKFDGGFITDQNIICVDKTKCLQLATEIREVLYSTTPHIILGFTGDSLKKSDQMFSKQNISNESQQTKNVNTHHGMVCPVPPPGSPVFTSSESFNPVPPPGSPVFTSSESFNPVPPPKSREFISSVPIYTVPPPRSREFISSVPIYPVPPPRSREFISSVPIYPVSPPRSREFISSVPIYPASSPRSQEFISSGDSLKNVDQTFSNLNISNEIQSPRVIETPSNQTSFNSISPPRSSKFSSRNSTKSQNSNIFSRVISDIGSWFNKFIDYMEK